DDAAGSALVSTDLSHFDGLRRLLAIERRAEEERVAEERSALSQAEREARGLSAGDLEAVEEDVGLGGRFLVTLSRAGEGPWRPPFRPGAVVEDSTRPAAGGPPQ